MTTGFASGRIAHGFCERCGGRCKLSLMKKLIINEKLINEKVCPDCWDPDQPQLHIGRVDKNDPQALREARPDTSLNNDPNVPGYSSTTMNTNNLTTNLGGKTFADGGQYS